VRFQGYWLRGHRRLDPGTANLARLAALPGVDPRWRLDLWRRASERHLIAGRWPDGLDALARAGDLLAGARSGGAVRRLHEWFVQALALAVHRGREAAATRILDLAVASTDAATRRELLAEADALLARLGRAADAPPAAGFRDPFAAEVRRGAARELASPPPLVLPAAGAWRHHLWGLWAQWGLALLADSDAPADARTRAGLRAVAAATDAAQRHATACAVVGRTLHGSGRAEPLVTFAIQRDIERLSGGTALPAPSPLPDLRDPAPWDTVAERRRGHALLGAALALGDDTGLIHAAVRLPQAGVPDRTRWSFWYPVPADPALRRALASAAAPADVLLAIARNESLFEPAVRSRAGALGYMQIMPFHYDDPAGAPGPGHWSHPATSIRAGGRILAGEIRRFGGDPYRAVAAYNAGSGAVQRWERQLGGQPDGAAYWAWIGYPETRGYTLRVLRDRRIYRDLLGDAP
jgi:soluble lytic murein transglycosylase-like protein